MKIKYLFLASELKTICPPISRYTNENDKSTCFVTINFPLFVNSVKLLLKQITTFLLLLTKFKNCFLAL